MLSVIYAGKNAYSAGKTSGVLRGGTSGANRCYVLAHCGGGDLLSDVRDGNRLEYLIKRNGSIPTWWCWGYSLMAWNVATNAKSKMAVRGFQNGHWGLEKSLLLDYLAIEITFAKKVFWFERSMRNLADGVKERRESEWWKWQSPGCFS